MTNDIKNQDRKYRPLVYVTSAYSGDVTTNTDKAKSSTAASQWSMDRSHWYHILCFHSL